MWKAGTKWEAVATATVKQGGG